MIGLALPIAAPRGPGNRLSLAIEQGCSHEITEIEDQGRMIKRQVEDAVGDGCEPRQQFHPQEVADRLRRTVRLETFTRQTHRTPQELDGTILAYGALERGVEASRRLGDGAEQIRDQRVAADLEESTMPDFVLCGPIENLVGRILRHELAQTFSRLV